MTAWLEPSRMTVPRERDCGKSPGLQAGELEHQNGAFRPGWLLGSKVEGLAFSA